MSQIRIPISPGELLDKIAILEIKSERITDVEKVTNVKRELELLETEWARAGSQDPEITDLRARLKAINESLWEIEDAIRDKEREKAFDQRFIELARSVYFTNDDRAAVKKQINTLMGSDIVEEKSYQDYS